MIKLILVRHGKTTCNEKGVLSGLTDSVLSETGKLQSQKIADYLKYTNIDKIYTFLILGNTLIINIKPSKDTLNMNETEKAYIAGIIDGEGSIMLQRFHAKEYPSPCVSIASTTLELLKWIKKTV